ncbi:MAG: hypothetical protein JWN46_3830 [Acidimicrobiales bacterium]|nr:hypothetical protein [Acidimicrobiales bacterium]
MAEGRRTRARGAALAVAVTVAVAACGQLGRDSVPLADGATPPVDASAVTRLPGDVPVPELTGRRTVRRLDRLEVTGRAAGGQGTRAWFLFELAQRGWTVGAVTTSAFGDFTLSAAKARRDLGVEGTAAGPTATVTVTVTLYDR